MSGAGWAHRLRGPYDLARKHPLAFWTFVSFLATVWIPLCSPSPTADVSGIYTDHVHHPFATWVAWTRGLGAVYRMPFSEGWQGTTWPYPLREWPSVPAMVYPPGVLALYTPIAVFGRYCGLDAHGFATVSMLLVLVYAHVSLFLVLRLLADLPGRGRLLVGAILWVQMLEFGLQGFHDSLVLGFAAWSITSLRREKLGRSLVLFALSMSLHYRAGAPFAGWGVVLLLQLFRGPRRREDWQGFAFLVAVGLASVVTLLWSIGLASSELLHLEVVLATPRLWIFVSALLVGYAILLGWHGEWLAALASLFALGLTLSERCPFYWHGAIVLAAPLLIGVRRPKLAELPAAWWLRGLGVLTFVILRPIVWKDSADYIFRQIGRTFLG